MRVTIIFSIFWGSDSKGLRQELLEEICGRELLARIVDFFKHGLISRLKLSSFNVLPELFEVAQRIFSNLFLLLITLEVPLLDLVQHELHVLLCCWRRLKIFELGLNTFLGEETHSHRLG